MIKKHAISYQYLNNKSGHYTDVEAWNTLLSYVDSHKDTLDIVEIDESRKRIKVNLTNTNKDINRFTKFPCIQLDKSNGIYIRATATYNCKYENNKLVLTDAGEDSTIEFNIHCIDYPETCNFSINNLNQLASPMRLSLLDTFFKVGILSYSYLTTTTDLTTLTSTQKTRFGI